MRGLSTRAVENCAAVAAVWAMVAGMDEIPPEVPGYRLTRLLGTGSTSQVWRARRLSDDELVAVKVLPGEADEEAVREYTLLQHAAGEHVVTLHETIALDGPEGSATALVLELLAGGSVAEVVAARGHLTPGETVTVIAPVAEALSGLHELGIVHGDLSPGNILLSSTGRPVLADLGFSRLTGEAPGDVHGTDGHVAPEVLDGAEPDRPADVHALGALAWLCLTGAPPGHVTERIDLADTVPGAPPLVEAIESCLASDPASRPEADETARAIFDAVPPEPLRMTSPGDVASGLTRRLREAAAEGAVIVPEWQRELAGAADALEGRQRWWRRRTPATQGDRSVATGDRPVATGGRLPREPRSRRATARHAAPRGRDRSPAPSEGSGRSTPRLIARSAMEGSGSGRRRGLLVTAGLTAALAVLVPWQQLATAGDPEEDRPSGTFAAPTGGREGVLVDRSAPRSMPTRLARELTDLRRQVVVDRDPDALERLVEPGSAAARHHRQLVERLTESGERYRGVDLRVRSARLERTTGGTAVVRATTDEGAYAVIGPDGTREQHPARRGQRVDLVLVWHEGSWRVRDVVAAR